MLYYTFGVSMCFLANHLVIGMHIEGSGINLFEQPNENNDQSDTFLAVPLLRPTDLLDSHYAPWTEWSACTRHCKQKRHRKCRQKGDNCTDGHVVKESRHCQEGHCSPDHKKENKTQNDNVILDREMANIIYDILYYSWGEWSTCTRSCKQKRIRTCAVKAWCHNTIMQEEKQCFPEGSDCEKHAIYSINNEKGKKQTELTTTAIPHPTVKSTTKLKTDEENGENNVKTENHALQCGIRKHEIVKRVVGGIEAHRGHWPWQVALLKRGIFGKLEQYCGGTLIGSQWVLTAAHCVRRHGRNRKVIVRIGEHDFDTEEGSEITSRVGKNIVHPGYERKTIDNDIALLQLKKPVTLSDHVDFACVPDQGQKAPLDSECYTIGWGKVRETHIFGSSILQQARIPLVENSKCQAAFEYSITDNQFCAGDDKGGVDSCSGDSGGPLMCRLMSDDGIKRWFVYGVTSFGEGCGEKGKYGIYSKVPTYSKWINEVVNKHS